MRALLLLLAFSCIAGRAEACRGIAVQPYNLGQYETVALAKVLKAEEVPNTRWITWAIQARATKALSGSPKLGRYDFRATLWSDGCRPAKLPAKGELWVLYIRPGAGTDAVILAFPRAQVALVDKRVP